MPISDDSCFFCFLEPLPLRRNDKNAIICFSGVRKPNGKNAKTITKIPKTASIGCALPVKAAINDIMPVMAPRNSRGLNVLIEAFIHLTSSKDLLGTANTRILQQKDFVFKGIFQSLQKPIDFESMMIYSACVLEIVKMPKDQISHLKSLLLTDTDKVKKMKTYLDLPEKNTVCIS
jgi:hypothetical protein